MGTRTELDLNARVATWRRSMSRRTAFDGAALDELESHLWDEIDRLIEAGISERDAVLQASLRLGHADVLAEEYMKVTRWSRTRRPVWHHSYWILIMWKNYLKIALRNLKRHPGSSFINITGLAIGMACCLVILLFVRDELRFDTYHEKGDQIYRLSLTSTALSTGESGPNATSSILWGPTMQREYPEIIDYARFVQLVRADNPWEIQQGDKMYPESDLLYADAAALDMFSWPLLAGDPETALVQPHSIVLTRSMAQKYFGEEEAIGRILTIDPKLRDRNGAPLDTTVDFTVTGVLADIPRTSHFTFDFLLSFIDLNDVYGGDVTSGENMDRWFWRGRIAHTYLLLRQDADVAALKARFPDFLERYIGDETTSRGYRYDLFLQPLPDIYLDGEFAGQIAPVGNLRTIYMFSIIAGFLLLIACINFMNLSTARSARRAKEVGMRKVVGAQRPQLMAQFLSESVIISFISLLIAVVLAWLVTPLFYQYISKSFVFDVGALLFISGLIGITLLVGIIAGSYPALYLSQLAPATMLKGAFASGPKGGLLRKGLVVFQFGISAFLIIATITVFKQLQFMRTQELGFDQERVLLLPPAVATPLKAHFDVLKDNLMQNPQIADVTLSSAVPGAGGTGDIYNVRGTPAEKGIGIGEAYVDYNFVDFYGLDILTGRNFTEETASDEPYQDDDGQAFATVLLNEEAVRQFGWGSPQEALGKQIVRDPRSADFIGTVVGVVKDFHVRSLQEPISPTAIVLWPRFRGSAFLSARLHPGSFAEVIGSIEEATRPFLADVPFSYSFLEEDFRAQYEAEERLGEIFTYISFLAILIACLGLFGLAAFTTEQRTKEIGVRKALGATVPGIITLLSKEFLKLVAIACVIAIPLGYLAASRWLEDFAYHINPGIGIFLLATGIALLIALLTVSYQSVKAARADPIRSLRYE